MSDRDKILAALQAANEAGDTEKQALYAGILQKMVQAEAAPENFGLGNAIRQGLQQGATFGFSDEISAAARAGLDKLYGAVTGDDTYEDDFGDLYRMYRESEREQIAGGREHHGGAMLAAEIVPGLVQGGAGLTKIAGGAGAGSIRAGLEAAGDQTLRQLMGRSAAAGAGYGGLAGVGYGQREGIGGMAADAATGAAMGGLLGGGLPAVGAGLKRGAQGIGRLFSGDRATEAARRAAYKDIVIAMERDGVTPQDIARTLADDPHHAAMVIDQGPHLQQLGKLAARQPGEGGRRIRDVVTSRQRQTPQRVQQHIRGFIEGSENASPGWRRPENFKDAERAIMDRARQQASDEDLWQLAYRHDYKAPRSMLNFLRTKKGKIVDPDARAAYGIAIRNLQRRVRAGELTMQEATMPARVHDATLRALRSRIKLQSNPMSRIARTSEETTLMNNQYRKLLDDYSAAAPDEWRRARALWAGEAANQEAYEAGQRVMQSHADDIAVAFRDMSQGEKDHYLVGALRNIELMLKKGGDKTDIMRRLRETQHGRELMRELAGSERQFQKFLRNAETELNFLDTYRKVTAGSDTFENIVGAAQTVGGEAGTLAGIMMQQSGLLRGIAGIPLFGRALGRRLAGGLARRDIARRDQLSDMLLSRDPNQFLQAMQRPQLPNPNMLTAGSLAGATQLPGLLE